jgi:rhodanese-related sulfurtransferase
MNTKNAEVYQEIIEQITVDKLDAITSENNIKIIDVRDPNGIETQGKIPGAINIPFDSIDRAIDKSHEDFNSIFDFKGSFLFCCTGGVMSYMAAIKAQKSGIKNVFNLEGGHSDWLKSKETNSN